MRITRACGSSVRFFPTWQSLKAFCGLDAIVGERLPCGGDVQKHLPVQYVLCWCVFPLAPALAPADASAVGFLRFVRRLHSYYDEVRLLVSVHHWLRLLAFPRRTAVHTQHATTAARYEISQVPMRSLCT